MSWTLDGTVIRSPHQKRLDRSSVSVLNRTLSGGHVRDFIGSQKMVIDCSWMPIFPADLQAVLAAYDDQRLNGTAKTLVINETGLSFSGSVLIVINPEDFTIPNNYEYPDFSVRFIEA
jgi:hypothetical protein